MNVLPLPTDDHALIQMQEQQQQPIYMPSNRHTQQVATAHVMPTPATNWSMESMPWKINKTDHTGNVMEFTAHAPCKNNSMRRAMLHQKRKYELNATGTLPVKQFISEEKITAHFSGLHISSDYIQHNADNTMGSNSLEFPSPSGKCFSSLTYEDYQITAKELEEKLRNANRITVCEELKKFNDEQKKVSYLPEALLYHRTHKPCTALVLWQPSSILNIFSQKNMDDIKTEKSSNQQQPNEAIDDTLSDVNLPPVQQDEIDDFIDNNNTCNLDLNNVKPYSMDEDM